MKILQLSSTNVKRLKAVHIKPNGELVVIGGNNGNGKTSVLDSIMYALGGKSAVPSMPIRKGQKSAEIELDLGELKVIRRFTESGSTVKVLSQDGVSFSSPQKMLDELVGRLSFDPMDFMRMKPAEQSKTLCDLVGIDTTKLDGQRKAVYDERTAVNRGVRESEAALKGMSRHEDAPDKETSITEAAEAYNRAVRENAHREANKENIVDATRRIESLKRQLQEAQQDLEAFKKDESLLGPMVDTEPLRQRMEQAEAINRKVRENAAYRQQESRLNESKSESDKLTARLDEIDQAKAKMIREAQYPIDGLSIDEEGRVLFGGIPFDQCSSAEQTRVSVAMGLAMNPKLRVLLIRDGSLLDENSMAMVADMAQTADAQVWIERVGKGDPLSIIIEDGEVAEGGAS